MRRILLLLALSLIQHAWAEPPSVERGLKPVSSPVPVDPDRRIALVIGNGSYRTQPLNNPVRDAAAVSRVLRDKLGFEVTSLVDANRLAMIRGLEEFRKKLVGAGVGLVYFAGHGIQMEGQNYLIPVDADMGQEDSVKYNTVSLQDILDELEKGKTPIKIVILDACRNNPFKRARGDNGGLAPVSSAAQGTIIAYATSPGHVALDGQAGENGLYTAQLLRAMQERDLGIEEVFKITRINVAAASAGKQIPWETTSLTGHLILLPGGALRPGETPLLVAAASSAGVARGGAPVRQLKQHVVGSEFQDCKVCPKMTVVPPGEFSMGSPESEPESQPGEGPQRKMSIPRPFAIGRYEVTLAEWDACLADGACQRYPSPGQSNDRDKLPVIDVSWEDAQHYLVWISKRTGRKYQLPSEAEWEYTARAGTTTARYWGDAIGENKARCRTCNTDKSVKGAGLVGKFVGHPWGLYDMLGNVWEWVGDCHQASISGLPDDASAAKLGDCSRRAIRGGSWDTAAKGVRAATRAFYPISRRDQNIGFRVAASLD